MIALLFSVFGVINFGLVLWVWFVRTPAKIVPAGDALGVVVFAAVTLCLSVLQAYIAWRSIGVHPLSLTKPAKRALVCSIIFQAAFVVGGVSDLFPAWTLEFVEGHTAMLLLGIAASIVLLGFGKREGSAANTLSKQL